MSRAEADKGLFSSVLRVQDLGFRVEGFGFSVEGLGLFISMGLILAPGKTLAKSEPPSGKHENLKSAIL